MNSPELYILVMVVVSGLIAFFLGTKRRIGGWWSFFFLIFASLIGGLILILLSPPKRKLPPDNPKDKNPNIIIAIISLIIAVGSISSALTTPDYMVIGNTDTKIYKIYMAISFLGLAIYLLRRSKRNQMLFAEQQESSNQVNLVSDEPIHDDAYKKSLISLNQQIEAQKNKVFGGGMTSKIEETLSSLVQTKEQGTVLLDTYSTYFKKDLIGELSKLNSSYEAIRRNVSIFINLGLVSEEFPHKRIDT